MKLLARGWLPAILAVFCAACGDWGSPARLQRQIEGGRRSFLEGRPLEAYDAFKTLLRSSPDRLEVLHGYARSCARLHLYNEALPTYQRALDMSVRSGQMWEEYVTAIASAAAVRRDQKQLDMALKKGAAALFLFPERTGLYTSLDDACTTLGNRAGYLKLLTQLHEKLPQAPVLAAELTKLRLEIARDNALNDTVDELTSKIRQGLKELETQGPDFASLAAPQLFHVFFDYLSLGEVSRAEGLVPLLDRTPEGLRLTRHYRRQRVEAAVAGAQDSSEKLRIVNSALELFKPTWEESDQEYWSLQALRFQILEDRARSRLAAKQEPVEGEVSDLLTTGMTLSTADTYQGAEWYVRTGRVLVDVGQHLSDAIRFSETGIRKLLAREPGLIYPARSEVDTSTVRNALISDLELIQAKAHLKNGQWVAAESLLRQVLETQPSGMAHALLGRSLEAQGELEEAYPEFVTALAYESSRAPADEQAATRDLAKETAKRIGKSGRLEHDIERQRRRISQNEEIRIVSERLDLTAPGFELTDLDGTVWTSRTLGGSVVVLNFWATWCGPCLREFPYYSTLVQEYASNPNVVFLALSIDEPTSDIATWLEERGYRFHAAFDNGTASDFSIEEIPATVVLDKEGKIQYRTVGFPGEERYLREMRLRIDALTGD